jgi:hypothetical protein
MKSGKRHHHTPGSSKGKLNNFSLRAVELFLLNWGLGITGAVIVILGLLFLVFNHIDNNSVLTLIQSFLKPGPEKAFNPIRHEFPVSQIFSLIFLYLPGFIILVVIFLLPSDKTFLKKSLILAGFLWLIFAEAKVFLYNAYSHSSFFSDFYSALIYFSIVQFLLILISAYNKNRLALNLSVIFFFISIALIRSYFGGLFPFFLLLVLFQFPILFLSLKFRWRSPFVTMTLLSGCYLIFYVLRKIILIDDPLPVSYMLPSLQVWFATSVTGLAVLKSTAYRKSISKLWDSISYLSPILVVGLSAYMAKLFGISYFIPLCTFSAIVTLIIVALLNERYHYLRSKRAFYFSICFFSASLVPQLLFSDYLLIFTAFLALTMLIHSHLVGSRASLYLSKIFYLIMISLYLVEWAFNIIHALDDQRISGEIYPVTMVLSCLLIYSISFFYIRLSSFIVSEHRSFQNNTIIPAFIPEICFPFIAYSSCFLVLDYALINIFPGYRLNFIELAMFTYAFLLLIFLSNPSGQRTKILVRTIVIFLSIAFYPVAVFPEVILYRDLFLEGNALAMIPFVLHFFTLSLLIFLVLKANGYLLQLFHNASTIRYSVKLFLIILISYILLSEYDNFSLLWFYQNSDLPVTEILRLNKYIPYSALLLFISISFLIYSLIRYSRFLRRVSLSMIILVILKVFFIDLKILTGNAIVILLITIGLILMGLALIIRRIRKKEINSVREHLTR